MSTQRNSQSYGKQAAACTYPSTRTTVRSHVHRITGLGTTFAVRPLLRVHLRGAQWRNIPYLYARRQGTASTFERAVKSMHCLTISPDLIKKSQSLELHMHTYKMIITLRQSAIGLYFFGNAQVALARFNLRYSTFVYIVCLG